jgi:hypothetical protein
MVPHGRHYDDGGFIVAALAGELTARCPALCDVAALVRAKDRSASIIKRPREGSLFDTTLRLPRWADYSFYGRRTYACDSRPLPDSRERLKLTEG